MMRRWFVALMLVALGAGPAQAQLAVAATTSPMGVLARAVGGEHVEVTVLAPPDRDPHYLEARPAMMAALRRADLVVAVGAELEVGWLPAALAGAHNPAIRSGRAGYFEAAGAVELIETDVAADRALGDVHPAGNPHFYTDPLRMAEAAHALAARLADRDGANAATYRANAAAFAERIDDRMDAWTDRLADPPGVLPYHKDLNYFMRRFEIPLLGFIEPLPGIPPTARHLRALVDELSDTRGVILYADFHPARGPRFLAGELGWPAHRVPLYPPVDAGADAYLALVDRWVEAVTDPGP